MEQNMTSANALNTRNLSLDILKILSMVMVIVLHTKTYGLKDAVITPFSPVYWTVWGLHILSLVAVNCFVLISGYFTSASNFNSKKIVKLWQQTFLFSAGIYLVFCLVNNNEFDFSAGQLLLQLLPLMSNQYWFFTCYFVLMILVPFINKFLDTLTQQEFKKFIYVLLTIFVVIPTLNFFGDSFDSSNGYSTIWFVVLYCVGAYLRRYPLPQKPYGIFYLLISFAVLIAHSLLENFVELLPLFNNIRNIFYRYNSATVFLASVCLFLFFLNHPIKLNKTSQKIICGISATTFGVYLLHEHPLLRDILWNNIVRLQGTTNSIGSYLARMIISVIVIFFAGLIVDQIVVLIISLLEKLIRKILKK